MKSIILDDDLFSSDPYTAGISVLREDGCLNKSHVFEFASELGIQYPKI